MRFCQNTTAASLSEKAAPRLGAPNLLHNFLCKACCGGRQGSSRAKEFFSIRRKPCEGELFKVFCADAAVERNGAVSLILQSPQDELLNLQGSKSL